MKHRRLSKKHVYGLSLFMCLLHLPFAFARHHNDFPENKLEGAPVAVSANAMNPFGLNSEELAETSRVYAQLNLAAVGLTRQVFDCAMKGFFNLKRNGKLVNDRVISIADFSKPSSQKRLFIIDLLSGKLVYNTWVAHGVNSGKEFANSFSNVPESNKSSLGFYTTADTYFGKHGYSLHINGVERGINDNALRRDIVIHGAGYVAESFIKSQGYIGRSWGCPAVPEQLSKPIIDKIKHGSCLFIYSADNQYFRRSAVLNRLSA